MGMTEDKFIGVLEDLESEYKDFEELSASIAIASIADSAGNIKGAKKPVSRLSFYQKKRINLMTMRRMRIYRIRYYNYQKPFVCNSISDLIVVIYDSM
jgi:hypothetical protein